MAEVILFEHINFRGAHRHFYQAEDNLNNGDEKFTLNDGQGGWTIGNFNDVASSIVVVDGVWRFFADSEFQNQTGADLGPGLYPWVEAVGVGIANDAISSLTPV